MALAAQGFGRPRPAAVGTRQLNSFMQRMGVLQLDSVNVFERSHYLPAFARLGPYDKAAFDKLVLGTRADYIEYWAHVAAVIAVEDWPLFQWRRDETRARYTRDPWVQANGPLLQWLVAELAAKGPLKASDFEHEANQRTGSWWGWSDVKVGLQFLFFWGDVVASGRSNFERTYALPEQRLPTAVLDTVVSPADARRALMTKATKALGIGTLKDIADYFRIQQTPAKLALDEAVEAGDIVPVAVKGWKPQAFMHRDAAMPRKMSAAAFLSPFDPVVWERDRALRLFDFHYRIEIYTPEPKRIFGYYSLPILIDDRIVGRIDLKSDRQNRVLRVQSAWREEGSSLGIEERIVPILEATRAWQGHDDVVFAGRGDLSASLEAAWLARA